MITGVEIDMVVKDSIKALEFYEKIFEVERVEVSDLGDKGSEAVFTIYGVRFHLLNENPEFMLFAPKEGDAKPMWLNVSVADIAKTFEAALENGCTVIFPVQDMPDFGVKNAMFTDIWGYNWMLHQIDKIVSHEERLRIISEQ